jgi:hypothetical protein
MKARVEQLEQIVRQLCESNEILLRRLSQFESGQERAAASGAKLSQDVSAVQQDVAKPKKEIRAIVGRQEAARPPERPRNEFRPSVKMGKGFDVPDGIIAHLTRRCGGNVHDCGVVTVTASSLASGSQGLSPKNTADLATDSLFHSKNPGGPGQWICYNFKKMAVRPTHYTLRTHCEWAAGATHAQNWVLEGSIDGGNWIELDRRNDNHNLNAARAVATFTVARVEQVSMVRVRTTGKNHDVTRPKLIVKHPWGPEGWGGPWCLVLSAFEIFGVLVE